MKSSDSLLKWTAIALGALGGLSLVFSTAFSTSGIRVGIMLFGLAMVANGALGIKTRCMSFARRSRKEQYEGSDAFIVGATSAAFGLVLVCWVLFSWAHQ